MKIAVECQSILLQKALEQFLAKYLVTKKQADVIIRDTKSDDEKTFYIATSDDADLKKPFSKSQLILALQNRLGDLKEEKQTPPPKDFALLEKRIAMLTREYEKNILETIKAFYG